MATESLFSTKTKKVMVIIMCIVLFLSFCMCLWGLYYYMFLRSNLSISTAYIDTATYSEEDKYFINLEYFSNENGNGIECFGARYDYYTDTSIPEQQEDGSYGTKYTYSSGVQFEGGYTYKHKSDCNGFTYEYSGYEMVNCDYYNSSNGVTFSATNSLEDMNHWVYDMDGQLCLIEEKGNVHEYNTLWVSRGTIYDTSLLMADLYEMVKSLPEGKQVITIDLSKYYNVYLFNGKEFDRTTATADENWVFVNVYVYKTDNGLARASQSMFGLYMSDPDWSLYGNSSSEYWKTTTKYDIDITDFTFTYENNGYYLKLQTACIEWLEEFKNLELNVTIDLDNIYLGSETIEIAGFTSTAFGDLDINKITLTSSETREFKYYGNLNIECSSNITLVEVENG